MVAFYTIVEPAAHLGWSSSRAVALAVSLAVSLAVALAVALGVLALALLVGFVAREATAANPLMPLRIFRSRNVYGANVIQALTVAGMFGMFFLGVLYLQEVLGYDALATGLAFLPTTLVMGTLSVR